MHRYKSIFNEEHLGTINIRGAMVEFYKNPDTITKMPAWSRGIIDYKGNLYLMEDENMFPIIHSDMTKWLDKNGYMKSGGYTEGDDPADYLNYFISVERYDKDRKKFVLAESYEEEIETSFPDEFLKYKKNFERMTNFILDIEI